MYIELERTITSRNAGSKLPANERCSLYRYEIEIYFSGFFNVLAETYSIPECSNRDRENVFYLGEV
jgi:hypothetical protein